MRKLILLTTVAILSWNDLPLAQGTRSPQEVLTMDECIKIALKNNYEVRAAEKNFQRARYDLLGTWKGFLPKADITSNWRRSDRTSIIYSEAGFPYSSKSYYRLGLDVNQTLFDGWYNVASYNYYKKGKLSAREDLTLTKQWVVLEVKNGCFALLKAQMLLEVQAEAVKRSEEQLNMAKAKYELGATSLSDYLKAKVQLSNDSLALISARNNIKLAEADLNHTLGREIGAPIQVDAKLEYKKFDPAAYPITEKTTENHPQITKAKSEVDQAHSWLTVARSENYPSIYLGVSYSWNSGKFPGNWSEYREGLDLWYVGLQVSLNIFNGLSTISKMWSAKASLMAAKEKLRKDRREVELEIQKAILAVIEAEQKIRVTEEALKAAEEDLNLTKEKYNLGAASMLELLDANYSYRTSKSNQVESLYDYNLAIAQFEKAVGK